MLRTMRLAHHETLASLHEGFAGSMDMGTKARALLRMIGCLSRLQRVGTLRVPSQNWGLASSRQPCQLANPACLSPFKVCGHLQ